MIRINLLGVSQAPATRGPAPPTGGGGGGGAPSGGPGVLLALLILGGTFGLMGWQTINAQRKISELNEQIKFFTEEKARLQAIIAQVQEYEAKVKRLEEKEKLIERLKRERAGPVHMLDEISGQLPDFIWLTTLAQSPGSIAIDGMAASYVSIADYIRKLEDSAYFQNVELVDAKQEAEYTKFQLRSQVVTPPAPGESSAAPAGGSPAGPGSGASGGR